MLPNKKMAAYRARMRAQGFRAVQIWVHDTRSETFRQEARRQSLLIAAPASSESPWKEPFGFIEQIGARVEGIARQGQKDDGQGGAHKC